MLDISWCIGALFMAWAAWMKIRAGSQPNGAWIVIGLGVAQVVAVIAGFEKVAYVANIAMVLIAVLLIVGERHWKKKQKSL